MNNPVNRLLRRNVSAGQIAGYLLANLAGLAIVLTAIQFYLDVTRGGDDADGFITRDYLILSKRVEGLGSLAGIPVSFSPGEIDALEAQPWAGRVAGFTAAAFNVYASVSAGDRRLGTSLFLESIPDEFFDVEPSGWDWDPESGRPVPIVISKDYLTLYNFGFAASAGLPQVSEAMVSAIPLNLSVSGNGRQQWLKARIAGFSSRLNTIAVPESFMAWANARFADEPAGSPRRLIVEVTRPGDPAIAPWLAEHGYEAAGDKADQSRLVRFLSVVTGVVIAVGAVISVLAFFILLLSIYLLLQKNRQKLHRLMELGYTPRSVAAPYVRLVAAVNAVVLLLALGVVAGSRMLWGPHLSALGLEGASILPAVATGVGVTLLITLLNIMAINRRVARAFRLQ